MDRLRKSPIAGYCKVMTQFSIVTVLDSTMNEGLQVVAQAVMQAMVIWIVAVSKLLVVRR
jgi:hypothetical protein